MKRFLIFSLALCSLSVTLVLAQAKNGKTKKTSTAAKPKPKPKYKPCPVYLGNSEWRGGLISKKEFDTLVAQGLTARDSAGTIATVVQFRIYFKERNLVEDSIGNYHIISDLIMDLSKGNKLNYYFGSSFAERTKKGDTALFDDIVVMMPDSATVQGLPLSFIIDK